MPDGPPPSPDDLPPGLREEYLAGMRATLGVLAGIAKRLAAAGGDREALETLRRETHKIHGSAGSFGFMEASRLAAGMEATAKDWIARPGDTDMDRAGLTGWFVTRLAEMLSLTVPAAAAAPPPPATTSPPRLIIRRPSAAQKAAAPPPAPPPLRPPERPEPPKQTPPSIRPSRPLTPFKKPSVAPAAAPTPPAASPPPAPPPAPPPPRREPPPERAPQPPPSAPPPPPPKRPPKPPPAQPEGIPWLVTPEESVPAKKPPAPAPRPQPAVEPPPAAATSAAPELILVEDDPALAELLEYGLRSRGYRFVSYRNGRDALRDLLALDVAGTRPLVLLDVDLPGLDGYSVLEGLERDRPGVYRVVFTTVHGGEAEQLRGLEAGALDYLVKPISLRVALEKIRRWVGR